MSIISPNGASLAPQPDGMDGTKPPSNAPVRVPVGQSLRMPAAQRVRPILFSAPMIRAILAGRKSMTRRVFNPQPPAGAKLVGIYAPGLTAVFETQCGSDHTIRLPSPKDRLWVREAWRTELRNDSIRRRGLRVGTPVYYEAGGGGEEAIPECAGRLRPGLFMPRWASRLTLIVTDVRVQRLQEISTADAVAEGLIKLRASGRYVVANGDQYFGGAHHDPRQIFRDLWDSLNAARGYGWETNPWVAAVTFRPILKNVDDVGLADFPPAPGNAVFASTPDAGFSPQRKE